MLMEEMVSMSIPCAAATVKQAVSTPSCRLSLPRSSRYFAIDTSVGRPSWIDDAEEPWLMARTSSAGRADDHGQHASTAATQGNAGSERTRPSTKAPRRRARPPQELSGNACDCGQHTSTAAHLDDWRTTVLFLLHSNQQAVALSDLLLKTFDLLHDFVCCQMQLKPQWREGHTTSSMKCIWHMMMDEAT
jgi:hypothetical protein